MNSLLPNENENVLTTSELDQNNHNRRNQNTSKLKAARRRYK